MVISLNSYTFAAKKRIMNTLISEETLKSIRKGTRVSEKKYIRRRLIKLGCGLTLAFSDFRYMNMTRELLDSENLTVQEVEDQLDDLDLVLSDDFSVYNILNLKKNAADKSIDMYLQFNKTVEYFEDELFKKDLVKKLVEELFEEFQQAPELGLVLIVFAKFSYETVRYMDKEVSYKKYIENLRNIDLLEQKIPLDGENLRKVVSNWEIMINRYGKLYKKEYGVSLEEMICRKPRKINKFFRLFGIRN